MLVWVEPVDVPRVADAERVRVDHVGAAFWRVTVRCGFLDVPDVPAALRRTSRDGLGIDPDQASYFVGRDAVVPRRGSPMAMWRQLLFAAMHGSAGSSADFFRLPVDRVIAVGSQIEL